MAPSSSPSDGDGEDVEHRGEYLELERPRRIVFALRVEKYAQESDRVIVDITPLASGCDVTVTHEMSPACVEYIKRTEEGWAGVLASLQKTLGGRA